MPRGRAAAQDNTTLQMALVGYEVEKQRIEQKIRDIQSQLGIRRGRPAAGAAPAASAAPKKRVLSAAARKRIAAAQRKRWAEHRKKMAAQAKA